MNEYEIEDAAERYARHPVLGPATRTLASLMAWTNANSDGWPYWRKPRQAAAKLTELVEQGQRHDRERYQSPRTPDVTADQYKVALRPVKAFRTRQANDRGREPADLFEIIEPGPGVGGEVWALAQVIRDAENQWRQAVARCEAARELLDRARADLTAAEQRQALADLRAQAAAGEGLPEQLARLARFDIGDQLWVMPDGGEPAAGEPGVVTGLEHRAVGACLTYRTPDGRTGRVYRPMSLSSARERYWIVEADGSAVRGGGWTDKQRSDRSQASHFPGCVVVQGSRFIPDPANLTDRR